MQSPMRCLAILTMKSPKGCLGALLYWRSSLRYDALLFWQQSLQCTVLLCCMEMQSSVVYMYIYGWISSPAAALHDIQIAWLAKGKKGGEGGGGGQGCRKLSSCNQRMVLSLALPPNAQMYGTLDMQSTKYCILTLSERSQVVYDLGDFNVPYFTFFGQPLVNFCTISISADIVHLQHIHCLVIALNIRQQRQLLYLFWSSQWSLQGLVFQFNRSFQAATS
jgi:hypothetical protein